MKFTPHLQGAGSLPESQKWKQDVWWINCKPDRGQIEEKKSQELTHRNWDTLMTVSLLLCHHLNGIILSSVFRLFVYFVVATGKPSATVSTLFWSNIEKNWEQLPRGRSMRECILYHCLCFSKHLLLRSFCCAFATLDFLFPLSFPFAIYFPSCPLFDTDDAIAKMFDLTYLFYESLSLFLSI